MECDIRREDGILIVSVQEPRLDAACAIQFKDRMRALCADAPARVLLDLEQVDFMDSSGLGAVVAVRKYLGEATSLELASLSAKVDKVFRLTRMDTVFRIHMDAAAATSPVSGAG